MKIIRSIVGVAAMSFAFGLGGCAAVKDVSDYDFKASGAPTMELERARAICGGVVTDQIGIRGGIGSAFAEKHKLLFLACMAEKGFVEAE